ncbi:TIGR03745 family integrating conjugative element membrane protein [Pokkaliibacter sp. MBI-7]|uniref:TIGR03745 family integrating conjugative element membrane protein n=1 Tax=Pokkaliibacter sp. MBI-7 TaxID=3040600 RepID=UPI00244B5720|nr:TIGR03745 family integrating conjugative element membrane protein [Pokkaliibacter sp. MBI-7]MDH2434783.1 TIGR03745 family integrating conjugative element membrane protein [Pokkaliibacter sp. MBI-7]
MVLFRLARSLYGRMGKATLQAYVILGSILLTSPAWAGGLPKMEAPSTGADGGNLATFKGYLYDALIVVGLGLATWAFLSVGSNTIATYKAWRMQKAELSELGLVAGMGGALVILVLYLANKAAAILA